MKTYRRYGHFQEVFLGLIVLMALLGGGGMLFPQTEDRPPPLFAVLWIGVIAWMAYWMLDLPRTITIHDDDTVEFRSFFRTRRVLVADIVSIKGSRSGPGWIIVRHRDGQIRTHTQFDGFHDFIATVKESNPQIELRGV